jgi:hypothetical protein
LTCSRRFGSDPSDPDYAVKNARAGLPGTIPEIMAVAAIGAGGDLVASDPQQPCQYAEFGIGAV